MAPRGRPLSAFENTRRGSLALRVTSPPGDPYAILNRWCGLADKNLQDPILLQRLYNQRLCGNKFPTFLDAVSWFGAVQAQNYDAAKWGLGMRVKNASDRTIEDSFNSGAPSVQAL